MTTQLEQVTEVITRLQNKPGALLPILHGIQDKLGYIPTDSVALIAAALNQSRADIHGVISFYHQFRTTPPGKHTVEVCRAEACQSMGARQLEAHAKSSLGVDYHGTTVDRSVTLEEVYCLGNCACAPSVRVNDEIVGRVTTEKFDQLIDELRSQKLEVL
ncbi:formate dehydrogenase subunit gamma [Amphritea balenae]|uniref:NADH-quinone oxidoreductase subunit E n=1 Tax=Amphritea balenae TaxID=452629 RepID=A0A3P1SW89_9GAMM|nr:formate dehydrogenase subunit gamma [Amphritea balenae]RRD01441.1 formate dehydrogenase subunit gamma [Amphritea balenae]GGK57077.1 formate dehydrogenase subunit gamma [Amphritea balenae]